MNIEKLMEKYPILYDSDFLYDFCIGDGWLKLVEDLSSQLEWLNALPKKLRIGINAVQVKEKFGCLRFYVRFTETTPIEVCELAYSAIECAERKSLRTCETCGKPGTACVTERGWCLALCEACATERKAKVVDDG